MKKRRSMFFETKELIDPLYFPTGNAVNATGLHSEDMVSAVHVNHFARDSA
jgi:hypothetical protein